MNINKHVLVLAKIFICFCRGGMVNINEMMSEHKISRATVFRDLALIKLVMSEIGMTSFDIEVINGYYILTHRNERCFIEASDWSLKK